MPKIVHIGQVDGKKSHRIWLQPGWRHRTLGCALCGVVTMMVLVVGCPPPPGMTSCTDNADCDDLNACTMDTCDVVVGTCANASIAGCCQVNADCTARGSCLGNVCAFPCLDGTDCEDNDACTDDACVGATCVNTAISCDDSNMCTLDSCDPATGCVNTAVVCTPPESCKAATGLCGTACTADVDCDDELFCNGTETCDLETGACVAGTFPCAGNGGCQANEICNETLEMCLALSEQLLLLTTAAAGDALVGTCGNDTFTAAVGTLQTVDILVGNGGFDTLNASVANATSTLVRIIDIDVINFTTFNATTIDALNTMDIGIWNIISGSTGSLTMPNLEANPVFTMGSGYAQPLSVSLRDATGGTDSITVTLDGTAAGAGINTPDDAALETLNLIVAADSSITAATTGTSFFGTQAPLAGSNNVVVTGAGMLTWAGGVAGDLVADTYNFTSFTGNTGASMANNPGATNVSTLPRFVRYTINDTAGGQNHVVTFDDTHNDVTIEVNTIPALAALGRLTLLQGSNNMDSITVNLGGAGTGTSVIDCANTEFFTINSGGTTANTIANVTTNTGTVFVTESITVLGTQNITFSMVTTESFDASAFTGTLSMAAANTMQIAGGSGVDTITGSGGVDLINAGAGNDSIDAGAGVDTITGGTGVDTLRVSAVGANGADRALFGDFDDTATTGDVINMNSGVAALSGTDNFATAATIQTHTAAGAVVALAATEVLVVTAATVTDLTSANSLNGTNLITAVGGTITGAIAGQNNILIAVADAAGNVGIYYASSIDNAIIAAEITLIATLSGANVTLANLVFGNFTNAL